MFCEKCGNKLPDNANFCPKCGNEFDEISTNNNVNNGTNTNINKDEVIFEVKSTFKFSYIMLPKLIKYIIDMIPIIFIGVIGIMGIKNRSELDVISEASSSGLEITTSILIIFGVAVALLIITCIQSYLQKKQYENYIYTFYKDRVVFKDSFLNVSEKELKYTNIREILKKQTFVQRYFNIGNIILYSNAEVGRFGGLHMVYIEDVDDVYAKIKEIAKV